MKTAISLSDAVFGEADSLASRMKVSRIELYVMALEQFIKKNQKADMTQRMDDCIAKHGQPIDDVFLHAALRDMRKVEW